jgi:hypothetical protein
MKYLRRADINNTVRLQIAIQALVNLGIYGSITGLANKHNVSRLFIYKLLWELQLRLNGIYQVDTKPNSEEVDKRKEIDRHILLARLEGKSSLEAISEILRHLGFPFYSICFISERIRVFAESLPNDLMAETVIVYYLWDEIFTCGYPILVTVEPESLAILKIELVTSRDAEKWKDHYEELTKAGFGAKDVVSDLAGGILRACALLGITHHPDLFHLLQIIALFVSRFEKQAYAAISEEYERETVFNNAKSERVLLERLALYESAKLAVDEAIKLYDELSYLWQELKAIFDLFDKEGNFKDPDKNREQLLAITKLMRELNCEKLNKELPGFEKGMLGYWNYFEKGKEIYQQLIACYGVQIVSLIGLAWQNSRYAINTKNYGLKQYFNGEAQHYLDWAETILEESFSEIKSKIYEAFDSNIRSSSLVENVNSSLRKLLDNCRGQVTQGLLNLFAYVHNHRPFLRGKRKDSAPIEILTKKPLEKSWIDSLSDFVYAQ